MKLTEFLEAYKNQDKDAVGSIKIRNYIPMGEKMDILYKLQHVFVEMQSGSTFNSLDYIASKELVKFFDILLKYTDIDVDERTVDMYDQCMNLNIDRFLIHYCTNDYKRFCDIMEQQLTINDSYSLREAITMVNDSKLEEEFGNVIKGMKDNLPMFQNLNEILGINNLGLKPKTK